LREDNDKVCFVGLCAHISVTLIFCRATVIAVVIDDQGEGLLTIGGG
jgi:hypothetical protein